MFLIIRCSLLSQIKLTSFLKNISVLVLQIISNKINSANSNDQIVVSYFCLNPILASGSHYRWRAQYEIIDNYLPEEEFQKILNIVEDSGFTWSLAPKLVENSDPEDYYFTRVLIEYGKELFPNSSEIVK